MKREKRDVQIPIMFRHSELELIDKCVDSSSFNSRSDFIRHCIFSKINYYKKGNFLDDGTNDMAKKVLRWLME